MATMMEAMMSMKKIMEANAVTVAATSAVAKVNPMTSSGLNQMNHPTLNMVGKDLGSRDGPHDVQIQNKYTFPPYGSPPKEDANNFAPILIESQQPQTNHAHVSQTVEETHEIAHHNPANSEPCLGYATEGLAVGDIPLQNTLDGPQPHPLDSTMGKNPHAMAEMGKLDHLEERLRDIEGGEDYAFNLEELFLVPNIITPPKFKVPDFEKYKGTTCPKNHPKMYCRMMCAYAKNEKLLIHFS